MTTDSVKIEIDSDSALVLFELLARFDETDRLEIGDRSETFALWMLHGALEPEMPVFARDYPTRVDNARKVLRIRGGEAGQQAMKATRRAGSQPRFSPMLQERAVFSEARR